jgi:hypothetical protein
MQFLSSIPLRENLVSNKPLVPTRTGEAPLLAAHAEFRAGTDVSINKDVRTPASFYYLLGMSRGKDDEPI